MLAQICKHLRVSGEASNQNEAQPTDVSQQNWRNFHSQPSKLLRASWHRDSDVYQRRGIIRGKIIDKLSESNISRNWPHCIPNMACYLEGGLFEKATSKEEYSNFSTLDQRMRNVLKSVCGTHDHRHDLKHHSTAMGKMIPTPGMQPSESSSAMIPTSGAYNLDVMNSASSSIKIYPCVNSSISGKQDAQQFSWGQNSYIHSKMDNQMNDMMGMGMQHHESPHTLGNGGTQFLDGNPYLMNATTRFSNMGNCMNTSGYNMHFYSNQQRQHHLMQSSSHQVPVLSSDRYARNASDLVRSENWGGHATLYQVHAAGSFNAHTQQSDCGGFQMHPYLPNDQKPSHQLSQNPHLLQTLLPQGQQHCLRQNNTDVIAERPELISKSHHFPTDQVYNGGHVQSGERQQGRNEQNILSHEGSQKNQPHGQVYLKTDRTVSETNMVDSVSAQRGPTSNSQQQQYQKHKKWLLLLHHASNCKAREGHCPQQNCTTVRELWEHMTKCSEKTECSYPRCLNSKALLNHHRRCSGANCPVCGDVRQIIFLQRQNYTQGSDPGNALPVKRPANAMSTAGDGTSLVTIENGDSMQEPISVEHPLSKKLKTEASDSPHDLHLPKAASTSVSGSSDAVYFKSQSSASDQRIQCPPLVAMSPTLKPSKRESLSLKTDPDSDRTQNELGEKIMPVKDSTGDSIVTESCSISISKDPPQTKQEETSGMEERKQPMTEPGQAREEPMTVPEAIDSLRASQTSRIKGVSLMELFTAEQVREHIQGLRQWVGQGKAKAEKIQLMEHQTKENACQLCAVERLTFQPTPIYCTSCGARIKRNAMYYTAVNGDTRQYFCLQCYNEVRGDSMTVDGATIPKSKFQKKKNDDEIEEAWVECDKCQTWHHQICALFNGKKDEGGKAEYTCPNCYISEIEQGQRKPLPQNAILGAKDLPKTRMSNHIEQRLFHRLQQERIERAKSLGKSYDEVPGAEGLVVRVVSSVDKKLEVKQYFREIFHEDNYPKEFPYKSKVLLLFQKIEGVEVCLFGMYLQEFGSECSQPNQRRVCISYIDSVKYFRPDVKSVTGEALRTFVYHEILIGYLEYCKLRGFASCYIWACPPLKGEDYILYCHPEIQKTPKPDKLREWYLRMLKKAMKENIVAELTNLYDGFFVTSCECKAKVTAACLPYFDGDYWPGVAEDMIMQLQQAENDQRHQKKGKTKKTAATRASKAAYPTKFSCNKSKDALLMQKLGQSILPIKEDFIMVKLQHACARCCHFILRGKRWACQQCKSKGKSFNLCEKCYEEHQKLDKREQHPVNMRDKHCFHSIEVTDVPVDTEDQDETIESEFFDTRHAFLSLCQGNHYQYDTLRRAKHSSMMVLYHLHNPTVPAFTASCNKCLLEIESGQGWRCETCPDFDICNACYKTDGHASHAHKLTSQSSLPEHDAQNKEARQRRVLELRIMLDLLVHASRCGSSNCQYGNCRRVKGLFRHGHLCQTRSSGGCSHCKRIWYILQLHARACKDPDCKVPRCSDLKKHMRRSQQQMESRRRAAVTEMMRQRTADAASNHGL